MLYFTCVIASLSSSLLSLTITWILTPYVFFFLTPTVFMAKPYYLILLWLLFLISHMRQQLCSSLFWPQLLKCVEIMKSHCWAHFPLFRRWLFALYLYLFYFWIEVILGCCNNKKVSPSGSDDVWSDGGPEWHLSCHGERGGGSAQTNQTSATSQQQQTQLVKR